MDNANRFKNRLERFVGKNNLVKEIIFYRLHIDHLSIALYLEYNDMILPIYLREKNRS